MSINLFADPAGSHHSSEKTQLTSDMNLSPPSGIITCINGSHSHLFPVAFCSMHGILSRGATHRSEDLSPLSNDVFSWSDGAVIYPTNTI